MQGPTNGSGYLAIVYAGQVRLYRIDDTGSMSYTLLRYLQTPPLALRLCNFGWSRKVRTIEYTSTGSSISTCRRYRLCGRSARRDPSSYYGGPTVLILSFTGGAIPPGVTPAPLRSNGQPYASLSSGTTQVTLSLTTDENATCRYATTPGVAYSAMANIFQPDWRA